MTIFGESAGAFSVDALVTSFSRSTKPPFQAAIMESGQSSVTAQAANNGSSWAALISALNCSSSGYSSDLECARAAPASTIKTIEERAALSFIQSVDNLTYVAQPNRARAAGQLYPVPILTGTNSNEGSLFTFSDTNTTAFLLGLGLPASFISQIRAVYPLGSYTAGGNLISSDTAQIEALYTDLVFQCPCNIVTNTSVSANIPTWRYFYNATFPSVQPVPGLNIADFGAYHSSEIPLVFGTYTTYPGTSSQQLARLSEYIQSSWATFARNPAGGPGWAGAGTGYVHVLGGPNGFVSGGAGSSLFKASTTPALDDGRCALWQPIYQLVNGA